MRLDLQPCDLGKAPRGGAYGSRRSSAVPRGEQGHDRGTPGQVCSSPQVYGCLHARLRTTAEARFHHLGERFGDIEARELARRIGWEIEPRFEARKGDQVVRGTVTELNREI